MAGLVLLTRPRADSQRLAGILEERGYTPLVDPMLEIERLPVRLPAPGRFQAVLVTSRHAVPALAGLDAGFPVFCVGEATAERVRQAGPWPVMPGPGDAVGLAETVIGRLRPDQGPLLHLAGADVRPELQDLLERAGFTLVRANTYRARPASGLADPTRLALEQRRIRAVMLFSPRTAAVFAALSSRYDQTGSDALCLSANVAKGLDASRFARVLIATRPEEAALLDLLEAPGHE
jgi:uroporphyrinogen-III synthase